MGMSIDKSISWITESILDMRKSQLCISDKLALKTAIDTLRKYQKIQEIVTNNELEWGNTSVRANVLWDVKKVVEDGNDSR